MGICECVDWGRDFSNGFLTNHHPRCVHYNPEKDAAEIIKSLLKGIRAWASDEDGVHPDVCGIYDTAATSVGEPRLNTREY